MVIPPEHKFNNSGHVSRWISSFTGGYAKALRPPVFWTTKRLAFPELELPARTPTSKARRNKHSGEPAKAAHKRCSWDRPIPQADQGPLTIQTGVDEDPGDDERDDGQDFERRQPVFWKS